MSQLDNELMDSATADDAVTVSASPPPRDPMEDADPSLTRKRPRLDSGGAEALAMATHADPDTVNPDTIDAADTADSTKHTIASSDQQVEMTIRSQPNSSSHTRDTVGDTGHAQTSTPVTSEATHTSLVADNASNGPGGADGPGDIPADSPPVIAIDDDDDDTDFPATYTTTAPFHVEFDADAYLSEFPYAASGDCVHAAHEIAIYLHTSQPLNGTVLIQLSSWLDGLPDQPLQWLSFYMNQLNLWDELANVAGKMFGRKAPLGDAFGDNIMSEEDIITKFFSSYLRLFAKLTQVDAYMFARWNSAEPYNANILFQNHLRLVSSILRPTVQPGSINLFNVLRKEFHVDIEAMETRLLGVYLEAEGLEHLLDLVCHAYSKFPLPARTWMAINTTPLVEAIVRSLTSSNASTPDSSTIRARLCRSALAFFQTYNADLQAPTKVIDTSSTKELINYFHWLILAICQCDSGIAANLVTELLNFQDPESPTVDSREDEAIRASYLEDPTDYPKLVANAWKFKLLRKYLVKGRMELRIMSIGFMDSSLVEIWKDYHSTALSTSHPVMQYLADFLLHERVVDYIISVDSHPQLISRSGNIVGFLVVTNRYSNAQTDAIWNTISHSSDPRVVSATMTMLKSTQHSMSETPLFYLCSKMYELPIESYTLDILRLLRDIGPKLLNGDTDWSDVPFQARPWNVCIRVLQDTSPGKESTKTLTALHHEAADQLRIMSDHIPPAERHQLLRECTLQVADKSKKATGSVRAIHILTFAFKHGEPNFLSENPDAVRDILEEMCAFIEKEEEMVSNAELTALQYRLELLGLIILQACEAIPTGLYQSIWDHLVGKYAHTNHRRDMAWSRFLEAVKLLPNNAFCKELATVCVSQLDPLYYTSGMFDFVATYGFRTWRHTVTTQEGTKTSLQIRGADLLWSMILSAPPQTIEDRAARLLASRYLELDTKEDVTVNELEEAHVSLVEQCMKELLSVYKILRADTSSTGGEMDIAISPETTRQNEQRFARTVLFLKLLLGSIRGKPELNRSTRSDSKIELRDIDLPSGEPIEVKFNCPPTHPNETLIIGSENTLQDLYNRLCETTGCTRLNLFAAGQRLDPVNKAYMKVSELGLRGQILLAQRPPGAEVSRPVLDLRDSSSVFESTLLSHFDEMFACMDADDYISWVLFDFLCSFPYQSNIVDSVISGTATSESLFPQEKPWQAKYAAFALEHRLKLQVRKNSIDDVFLVNSVRYFDKALLSPGMIERQRSTSPHLPLPGVLVGILLAFLKERPTQEISAAYFSNERALVERLLELVHMALTSEADFGSTAYQSYCTIVEASLHARGVWDAFVAHEKIEELHGALLLHDKRKLLRERVAKAISSVCGGGLSPACAVTEEDIAKSFWRLVSGLLPQTVQSPEQSLELFDLADSLFHKYDEYERDEASLRSFLATWSALLLGYEHDEKVGRNEIDPVVLGLTKLLRSCVSSLKSFKKPLNAASLIDKIWHKYLFTPRVAEAQNELTKFQIPVLETRTRRELYDLVVSLAEDQTSYGVLLNLTETLGEDNPTVNTISLCVDRANEIRAPTGYVGLYNPRAICYMNSLLTQLFMNVNFRKFILGLNVTDPRGQQFLLHHTQKLFAEMQNSYRKSADPRDFAACVKAPEGTPIDINIQMDADEFYNLLFDQWEGQMLASGIKEQFRSFYGGQTINQIKSKECEHVSERVESFFVVQCDVQGKQNLIESLQSFVEGDVMEGDNKYKCDSCGGKLVDAVKRTCLKDVPDNLIFHLKRFDFDLVELRRAKINDQFEFPSLIDVSPFKIDHLSDPSQPRQEDIFELVGVLVHQGTSENGHYYSYIRERPSSTGAAQPWVEFNDRDVDPFDPSSLGYHAYGGFFDDQFQRQQKQFSAYMLFYQRRTAIIKDHNQYIGAQQSGSAKVPIPLSLEQDIQAENDSFVREYSLYDPAHTKFVRHLLTSLRMVNHGTCTEDHRQEHQALHIVLEHLAQTHFRDKNPEGFDETMAQLRRTVLTCPACCQISLKWLAAHPSALANMLLHCLHARIRVQTRLFLIDSLVYLREKDPVAYGTEVTESESESGSASQADSVLVAISSSLRKVCNESSQTTRGWDDLYLALGQLSDLGQVETAALLDQDLLSFGLSIFCMPAIESCRDTQLWRVVEKKRRIYNRLIEFIYRLLSRTDLHLPVKQNNRASRLDDYERNGLKFALTRQEKDFLYHWHEDNRALAFLDSMLDQWVPTKSEIYYPGEILKLMLKSIDTRLRHKLFTTVCEGIHSLEPRQSDPYVRAALEYCEASPDVDYIDRIVDCVHNHISKYPSGGGEVNLRFMKGLLSLENEHVLQERGNTYAYLASLQFARSSAPIMVFYDDEVVRTQSVAHFEELLLRHRDERLSEDVLKRKYKAVRMLLVELSDKIVHEFDRTTRIDIQPVARLCETLALLITNLYNSGQLYLELCQSAQDSRIVEHYQNEVLPRLQDWPFDESTPVSTGDAYEPSEYGSESEMDPELNDLET